MRKNYLRNVLPIVVLTIVFILLVKDFNQISHKRKNNIIPYDFETPKINSDSLRWNYLVEAIIKIESNGIDDTVNEHSGATGVLQILPIYVKDANRIIGKNKFKLKDRFSREASIEMFNIIQNHYNPSHEIVKAIHLHNPRANKEYTNKIIEELNA